MTPREDRNRKADGSHVEKEAKDLFLFPLFMTSHQRKRYANRFNLRRERHFNSADATTSSVKNMMISQSFTIGSQLSTRKHPGPQPLQILHERDLIQSQIVLYSL